MPTLFSHPVVPLAIAVGLGTATVPKRLLALGIIASMVPDLDVMAFRFGIAYAHDLGHRGITHSFFFAIFMALAAIPFSRYLGTSRKTAFLFTLICAASHGLLDMLTNGGLGVAYFWPFSSERYFFPCQVIQASPLSLSRVFGPAGLLVFESELEWLWLPAAVIALLTYAAREYIGTTRATGK